MRIQLFAFSTLLLLGCSDTSGADDAAADAPVQDGTTKDVITDAGPADGCGPGEVFAYTKPGCGADAHGFCRSEIQDACAIPVCSCEGQTIVSCDFATEPFQFYGSCDDAGHD